MSWPLPDSYDSMVLIYCEGQNPRPALSHFVGKSTASIQIQWRPLFNNWLLTESELLPFDSKIV